MYCLKCLYWLLDVMEWYYRKRFYGWLDCYFIEDIYKEGCYVVVIGLKIVGRYGYWIFDFMVWRLLFLVVEKGWFIFLMIFSLLCMGFLNFW